MSGTAQQQDALRRANVIRRANAAFKNDLAAQPYLVALDRLATVLLDEDELEGPTGAIPVANALRALPRIREHKTAMLLRKAGILAPTTRLRSLTINQRTRLALALRVRSGMADFDMRDHVR